MRSIYTFNSIQRPPLLPPHPHLTIILFKIILDFFESFCDPHQMASSLETCVFLKFVCIYLHLSTLTLKNIVQERLELITAVAVRLIYPRSLLPPRILISSTILCCICMMRVVASARRLRNGVMHRQRLDYGSWSE